MIPIKRTPVCWALTRIRSCVVVGGLRQRHSGVRARWHRGPLGHTQCLDPLVRRRATAVRTPTGTRSARSYVAARGLTRVDRIRVGSVVVHLPPWSTEEPA